MSWLTTIPKSNVSTSGTWPAADIPDLNASKITAGTIATARLGSGTADSTTFLRGDQTFAAPGGSGLTTPSSTDTFTNKTINADGTGNTITNIEDADIKAAANIAKSKVSTTGTWAAADIPSLDASKITTGTMATARLGSGTPSATTFLRGDQTYAVPAGAGSVDYTIPATAMANVFKIGATTFAYEADGTPIDSDTDSANVINAAIVFLPAANWSLNIMAGSYTITSPIDFGGKSKGHCHWGGVTFISNVTADYVVKLSTNTAQNYFSGLVYFDLATNDKKFGLQLLNDCGINYFENVRVSGHTTNKATIGIALMGTSAGLANDDNVFGGVELNHCTVGIQLAEATGGCNVYHNTFHHVTTYGTVTMVQTGRNALQNEVRSMGLETGTRFIRCAGGNNVFECVYASGGSPIIGDMNDVADLNTVYVHQYASHLPLTDTSTAKTTSLIFMGKNTIALSTITPGASPYTYTNADLYEEDVTVGGGTVSAISLVRGGVTTALTGITSGVFRLGSRDGLVVTYSSAPTMRKIPR